MKSYIQLLNQLNLGIKKKKRYTYCKASNISINILTKLVELKVIDSFKYVKKSNLKKNKELYIYFKYKNSRNLIIDIINLKHYIGKFSLSLKKIKRMCNHNRNSIFVINTIFGIKLYSYRLLKIQKKNYNWVGGQPLFKINIFE